MFRSKSRTPESLETAVREALGQPEWLQAVIIRDKIATLVITADPENMERSETLRLEAESRARGVDGIEDANAVLTADSAPGTAGAQRVRKGDGIAAQSLQSNKPAASAAAKASRVPGVDRIIAVASAKGRCWKVDRCSKSGARACC